MEQQLENGGDVTPIRNSKLQLFNSFCAAYAISWIIFYVLFSSTGGGDGFGLAIFYAIFFYYPTFIVGIFTLIVVILILQKLNSLKRSDKILLLINSSFVVLWFIFVIYPVFSSPY